MENKIEEKEKEIENEKNLLDTGDDEERISKLKQKRVNTKMIEIN